MSVLKITSIILILSDLGNSFRNNFFDKSEIVELLKFNTQKDYTAEIEVAIFCDVDFSRMFQYDQTKIEEYWTVVFYDVQLRFQTLQQAKVVFKISSIVPMNNTETQPFIEQARTINGTVSVQRAQDEFEKWLYSNLKEIANYDIALLATGLPPGDNAVGTTNEFGACSLDIETAIVKSSLTVTVRNENLAGTVAHEFAHLLGAPHDTLMEYFMFPVCPYKLPTEPAIMKPCHQNLEAISWYYFSPCSDDRLAFFLKTAQAKLCLNSSHIQKWNTKPIIDTTRLVANPFSLPVISMTQQCQLQLNDTAAYVHPDAESCNWSICQVDSISGNRTEELPFRPFDGSPCNNNTGRCRRGYCDSFENYRSSDLSSCASVFLPSTFFGESVLILSTLIIFSMLSQTC